MAPPRENGKTRDEAAALLNVSARSVDYAAQNACKSKGIAFKDWVAERAERKKGTEVPFWSPRQEKDYMAIARHPAGFRSDMSIKGLSLGGRCNSYPCEEFFPRVEATQIREVGATQVPQNSGEAPPMPGQGKRTDLKPRDNVTKLMRGNDTNYLAARLKKHHPEIVKRIEAVIRDDPEALAMRREEMTGEKHKHKADADNVSIKPEHGNSREYTVSRLRNQRPDLFERVKAGELSANA